MHERCKSVDTCLPGPLVVSTGLCLWLVRGFNGATSTQVVRAETMPGNGGRINQGDMMEVLRNREIETHLIK